MINDKQEQIKQNKNTNDTQDLSKSDAPLKPKIQGKEQD